MRGGDAGGWQEPSLCVLSPQKTIMRTTFSNYHTIESERFFFLSTFFFFFFFFFSEVGFFFFSISFFSLSSSLSFPLPPPPPFSSPMAGDDPQTR